MNKMILLFLFLFVFVLPIFARSIWANFSPWKIFQHKEQVVYTQPVVVEKDTENFFEDKENDLLDKDMNVEMTDYQRNVAEISKPVVSEKKIMDICLNIEGIQTVTPVGFLNSGGFCSLSTDFSNENNIDTLIQKKDESTQKISQEYKSVSQVTQTEEISVDSYEVKVNVSGKYNENDILIDNHYYELLEGVLVQVIGFKPQDSVDVRIDGNEVSKSSVEDYTDNCKNGSNQDCSYIFNFTIPMIDAVYPVDIFINGVKKSGSVIVDTLLNSNYDYKGSARLIEKGSLDIIVNSQ